MKRFIKNLFCIEKVSVSLLQLVSLLIIFTITNTLFDAILILCLSAVFSIGLYYFEILLKKLHIELLRSILMFIILGPFAVLISVLLQNQTGYTIVCSSIVMSWYLYSRMPKNDAHKKILVSLGKKLIIPAILLIPFSFLKELLSSGKIFQSFVKDGITLFDSGMITYASTLSFVLLFVAIILLISKSFFKKVDTFLSDIYTQGMIKSTSIILVSSTIISIATIFMVQLAKDSFIFSHLVLLLPYFLTGGLMLAFNYLTKDIDILTSHFSIILIVSICLSQITDITSMLNTLILFCIPLYIVFLYGEFCQDKLNENKTSKLINLLAYASIITLIL